MTVGYKPQLDAPANVTLAEVADETGIGVGALTAEPGMVVMFFVVNGIEQGLFVVRPRATPQGLPAGLSVTISGPGGAAVGEELQFVVRVSNHGPARRSDIRVIEMPPAAAQLVSARTSQGTCSLSSVVTCDLRSLAPGSDAFIVVTIRATADGDAISTAVANGTSEDGSRDEIDAAATTRVVRHAPMLTLRRPVSETQFRLGRNNTVQWTLRGVAGGVRIELSRDDGATWTGVGDVEENVGFHDWTGAGTVTAQARIRVSSITNPALTQTSPTFSIVAR